jgi:hypothetical protein
VEPDSISALVDELEGELEALADATLLGMSEEPPAWMADPAVAREAREFTADAIRAQLQIFKAGAELPTECPAIDADGARRGARAGSPLSLMLDGYRAGHRAQWDAWLELVERREPDRARRLELLRQGSDFFFAYAARLSSLVTDIYMAERDQAMRSSEQRRVGLVTQLLEGAEIGTADLGYPLERLHLGISANGPGAGELLRSAISEIGAAALVLNVDKDLWWAWVAGEESERALARAIEAADHAGAVAIGLGTPAAGVEGFRTTHDQAGRARVLAAAGGADGRALTRYADVALEDVAARDEAAARAFVAAELTGIDGDEHRQQSLRETLLAYFRAGQNAKSAGAALGVHQQTVAQRLRSIEEQIGRPVEARRAELEAALRLRAILG